MFKLKYDDMHAGQKRAELELIAITKIKTDGCLCIQDVITLENRINNDIMFKSACLHKNYALIEEGLLLNPSH